MNRSLLVAVAIGMLLVGCIGVPSGEAGEVRVVVTTDFGKRTIVDASVVVSAGSSALDATMAATTVDLAYGGGFVHGIDGIRSNPVEGNGHRRDWFYYVDGLLANVGAASLPVGRGDLVHWDYHDWRSAIGLPAIAGDFPRPFLSGPGGSRLPTSVAYGSGLAADAGLVANRLSSLGVQVHVRSLDEVGNEPQLGDRHWILVGTFDDPWISDLGVDNPRLGLFARNAAFGILLLDAWGQPNGTTFGAVVEATQNPWFDGGIGAMRSEVLAIVGATPERASNAVRAWLDAPERFARLHSVVVDGSEVRALP